MFFFLSITRHSESVNSRLCGDSIRNEIILNSSTDCLIISNSQTKLKLEKDYSSIVTVYKN